MAEENKINDLKEYLKNLENFKLPEYKELSDIPLYMEQVIGYIQQVVAPLDESENIITPFMVNNYVKAKIVEPPVNKKYDKNHLAYLIAITILKSCVSMKDLRTLIEMDKYLTDDKQNLYLMFKQMQDETLKNKTHQVKVRLDTIEKASKKKKDNTEENLNLSYIALRLYIESVTTKFIADTIMEKISVDVLPKEALEEPRRIEKIKNKTEYKEAKQLATTAKKEKKK